ncbi:urease accessory protein UreE [Haloarchaeobius salinus]|uniref:urease accessory protein UreE n=1 Tax=Haloarchaeobius salinus TaxID=1198298 RepID=UPI00210AD0D4|nr:urease accessory protein UreE [Haloarchaeobius salinus]
MLVADRYLGHRDDGSVATRLADTSPASVHDVVLSETDRRRSRVRTTTTTGRDLGVLVARDLADGDVLATEDGELVVVELEPVDALVLDLAVADISVEEALELGHALGNRHWDLAMRGSEALFPVPDTRDRMRATVRSLVPEGVPVNFESVPPTTFDDGGGPRHRHVHDIPPDETVGLDVRSADGGDG